MQLRRGPGGWGKKENWKMHASQGNNDDRRVNEQEYYVSAMPESTEGATC